MDLESFYRKLVDDGAFSEQEMSQGALAVNSVKDMPLHCAILMGESSLVAELLGLGAPVNARGEFGFTPLHCAAFRGHRHLAEILLSAGADPAARSDCGETARELALSRGGSW